MQELILRSGKRAGRRITLPMGDVIIGRDEGCRIRLTSSDVSRQHCRLRCNQEVLIVSDLGSRNGTFINEKIVSSPTPLKPGDMLRVGPFVFQAPGGDSNGDVEEEVSAWLTVEGSNENPPPVKDTNDTTLINQIIDDQPSREQQIEVPLNARETQNSLQNESNVDRNDPVLKHATEIIREYWRNRPSPSKVRK